MQYKIIMLFALLVGAYAAPTTSNNDQQQQVDEVNPSADDQEAQNQFFYSYGYGVPYYTAPALPAVKAVVAPPAAAVVPAATVKVLSHPATVYSYPAYYGFPGYGYHYVI